MCLLHKTAPAVKDTWVECLDGLSGYRSATEDDQRDREIRIAVVRCWYLQAVDRMPDVGSICLYNKSMMSAGPFSGARGSIQVLIDPVFSGGQEDIYSSVIKDNMILTDDNKLIDLANVKDREGFWLALDKFGWSTLRRFLRVICRLDIDTASLAIFGALLIPQVEAMPQGLLDNLPDIGNRNHWTRNVARFLAPCLAAIMAVRGAYLTDMFHSMQQSVIGSWLFRNSTTIFGLSTLLHCVAWLVTVGLIDQGHTGFLKL